MFVFLILVDILKFTKIYDGIFLKEECYLNNRGGNGLGRVGLCKA